MDLESIDSNKDERKKSESSMKQTILSSVIHGHSSSYDVQKKTKDDSVADTWKKRFIVLVFVFGLLILGSYALQLVLYLKNTSSTEPKSDILEDKTDKHKVQLEDFYNKTTLDINAIKHQLLLLNATFADLYNKNTLDVNEIRQGLFLLNGTFEDFFNKCYLDLNSIRQELVFLNTTFKDLYIKNLLNVNSTRQELFLLNATFQDFYSKNTLDVNSIKQQLLLLNVTFADLYNKNILDVNSTRQELFLLNATFEDFYNTIHVHLNSIRQELDLLNATLQDNFLTKVEQDNNTTERPEHFTEKFTTQYKSVNNVTTDRPEHLTEKFTTQYKSVNNVTTDRPERLTEKFTTQYQSVNNVTTDRPGHLADCPGGTFSLPRNNQATDYVQYWPEIPEMDEITVCSWIKTNDFNGGEALLSYAIPDNFNALIIFLKTFSSFDLYLNDSPVEFNIGVDQKNERFHLCVWFSSIRKEAGTYLNGTGLEIKDFNSSAIQGGGNLILGQEQDSFNGDFEPEQSFTGNITNILIWPRVLSSREISEIAQLCVCPRDYVVAMTSNNTRLYGEAYYSVPSDCPTL